MKVLKAPLALILSLAMILSMGTTFALAGPLGETRERAITVDDVKFGSETVGTAVGATSIVIKNSSNASVGISAVGVSSVDLATISEEFTIATKGTEEVPANGEITDWEIQPVDDLPVGEYAGTIFVIMEDDTVATADVTFEVLAKDVDADTYTVTFKGGEGATGTAPTQENASEGDTFELPANTFNKTGFTFAKWSDGTTDYGVGDTFTMPAKNVTFTATWTEDEPVVDKAELNKAITEATAAKVGVEISVDGTDVPKDKKWVTQNVSDTFDAAIGAAKAVEDKTDATQAAVNTAVATLDTAKSVYVTAKADGTMADKTALNTAITEAKAAKATITVSPDGKDVAPTAKWVTPGVNADFNDAIDAAQAVVDKADATQAEVSDAVTTLNTAKGVYVAAQKDGTAQPGAPVITTGSLTTGEVGMGYSEQLTAEGDPKPTWSLKTGPLPLDISLSPEGTLTGTPTESGTFPFTVEATNAKGKATKDLTLVITANKATLEASIKAAIEAKAEIVTSIDGSDVAKDKKWVTAAELADFNDAIDVAQAVADKADATQAEVGDAVTTLNTAKGVFVDAQKPGTKTDESVVDKAELNKAITEATAAKNAVVPSADGTDVATDKTWATADNIAAFATAIAAAEAVNANPNATQEDVEDAVVTLNDAQAAFAEQTASGTKTDKPVEASKAALKMEITLANNAAKGVEISVDGSDISKDAKWVTKAVAETFAKAIAAAQAVVDDTKVDQAAVDTATKTLNTAKGVFVDAQKPGTKPGEPVTADKTVLNTSIEAATEAKVNVAVSVNGSDVAKDKKWVTKAVAETFDTAIAAAEKVAKDTKATQATVDNAVKALNTAKGVYVAAQKNGTYTASSGGSDGGSGSGSSGGSTNTANDPATTDKVKDTIDIIKDLPGTLDPAKLPAGVTVDKTAGGSSIATIPVTMTTGNANLNTDTLDTLGAGSSKVGLKITVTDNSSKGKESVEIIIPGGFGKINEPGRLAFPMDYKPEADDNAKMLAAVKTANATSTTAQIGGNFNLPVAATITVKSAAPEGATVHIYKYDPATGKMISIGSAKVVDGKLTFATKMMGQMLFTTGTV